MLTPDKIQTLRLERELDERNRPLTDEELDQLLPSQGYEVIITILSFSVKSIPKTKQILQELQILDLQALIAT